MNNYPFNYYYQPQEQLAQLRQNTFQQNDERIWISNKSAADAYLVAPNGFVRLWDSSTNKYYEKRADATGRPYIEAYEYKRIDETVQPEKVDYSEQLKALENRISALESKRARNDKADKSVADDK